MTDHYINTELCSLHRKEDMQRDSSWRDLEPLHPLAAMPGSFAESGDKEMIAQGSTPDDIRLELPKKKITLKRREDIVKLCRGIADQEREYVLVISLKQTQEVSSIRIVSIGSRLGTLFNPSTVFRGAIMDESHGIVMVHNHPGGNVNPSRADKQCLKRLIKIGRILDIFVLESLIVSGKKWQSFMPRKKK